MIYLVIKENIKQILFKAKLLNIIDLQLKKDEQSQNFPFYYQE